MAVTNNTNFLPVTGNYSSTDRQGYRMSFNNTTKITLVTVDSSVNPTRVQILNHSDHAVIATATFSGQVATFATPVDVAAANDYDVIVDNSGSSYTTAYRDPYNLPATNTDIDFDATVYYNGSWTTVTSGSPVGGIISVTTDAAAGSPAPSVSDSITITESVTVERVSDINVNDTVTITESVVFDFTSFISVSDSVTILESVEMSLDNAISVSDDLSITESVTLTIDTSLIISVSDDISITESLEVLIPTLHIDMSDSVSITESVTIYKEAENIGLSRMRGGEDTYPLGMDDLTIL